MIVGFFLLFLSLPLALPSLLLLSPRSLISRKNRAQSLQKIIYLAKWNNSGRKVTPRRKALRCSAKPVSSYRVWFFRTLVECRPDFICSVFSGNQHFAWVKTQVIFTVLSGNFASSSESFPRPESRYFKYAIDNTALVQKVIKVIDD